MVGRSGLSLGLAALVVAGLVLVARSLRADLRRTQGQAAEHEPASGGRVGLP